MYHMMYGQAEQDFDVAAKADPNCGMAQWGIAMSVIHPLWGKRSSDENLQKGQAALEKAAQQKNMTAREAAYIKAAAQFYENWENTSYADQLKAFEAGHREAHETFPDDVEAAAFYALGQLATAPKNDPTFAKNQTPGQLLEKLLARAPNHPGLFH